MRIQKVREKQAALPQHGQPRSCAQGIVLRRYADAGKGNPFGLLQGVEYYAAVLNSKVRA